MTGASGIRGCSQKTGTTDNYTEAANQTHAKNLKGKLMLVHGEMDDNVPPYNTQLVVDALVKAGKDFDLLMLPARTTWVRAGQQLRHAPSVGLFREEPSGRGAAEGVSDWPAADRSIRDGGDPLRKISLED